MSPMRTPAVQYLAVRALGAPAVVVSLAVQGVFRGFKDTKTPLYASCKMQSVPNIHVILCISLVQVQLRLSESWCVLCVDMSVCNYSGRERCQHPTGPYPDFLIQVWSRWGCCGNSSITVSLPVPSCSLFYTLTKSGSRLCE